MTQLAGVILTSCMFCAVMCIPLDDTKNINTNMKHIEPRAPRIWKRFINPSLPLGGFADFNLLKMRTKRSTGEECEKLQLCKLHARSGQNFFAAYELYFVNKENAKLWDHRAHSAADCERRFSGCYVTRTSPPHRAAPPAPHRENYEFVDDDYY